MQRPYPRFRGMVYQTQVAKEAQIQQIAITSDQNVQLVLSGAHELHRPHVLLVLLISMIKIKTLTAVHVSEGCST